MDPIVAVDRIEEATVQKGNAAVEFVVVIIDVASVLAESNVKERLQDVVEEIIVSAVFLLEKLAEKLPRPCAPLAVSGYAEPAFLLKKVKENDLP